MIFSVNKNASLRPFQLEIYYLLKKYQHIWVTLPRQHGKTKFFRDILVEFLMTYNFRANPVAIACAQTIENCKDLYFNPIMKEVGRNEDNGLQGFEQIPRQFLKISGNTRASGEVKLSLFRPPYGDWATVRFLGAVNIDTKSGGTTDFLLCDEAALYRKGVYEDILKPMVDDTGGKSICTSTVRGYNHYWTLGEVYKKKMQKGSSIYGYYYKDINTAGVRGYEKAKELEDFYRRTYQMSIYYRQYLCRPSADGDELHPFAEVIQVIKDNTISRKAFGAIRDQRLAGIAANEISVACDIGKIGNFRAFGWVRSHVGEVVVDFKDDYKGSFDFCSDVFYRFSPYFPKINLIFPSDVDTPVMKDSQKHITEILDFIESEGYYSIAVYSLKKIISKEMAIRQAIEYTYQLKFSENINQDFLEHLQRVEYKSSKRFGGAIRDSINKSAFSKNNYGDDHTADAYVHMVLAIKNGIDTLGVLRRRGAFYSRNSGRGKNKAFIYR